MFKKLMKIQSELKAPKSQFNSFGKYNYRNVEDILEALKPLLLQYNCSITISDEIVLVGERYYIKSTVTFIDVETERFTVSTGFAREEIDKKGMDQMQLTGATSSYARKYALNGMFSIDDTKDSDTTNTHEKNVSNVKTQANNINTPTPLQKASTVQNTQSTGTIEDKHRKALYASYKSKNITDDEFKAEMIKQTKKEHSKDLTMIEFKNLMKWIENK